MKSCIHSILKGKLLSRDHFEWVKKILFKMLFNGVFIEHVPLQLKRKDGETMQECL